MNDINEVSVGPKTQNGKDIDSTKHRMKGETFTDKVSRIAAATASDDAHRRRIKSMLLGQEFLPAGRIQAGAGTGRSVTLFNCFVMNKIEDDMAAIFDNLKEAALTMQQGGGIGYDFSSLRPARSLVRGVDAEASGPVTFMDVWDAMCKTIMSAGTRRGAMMATMRCDHPDIVEFVTAKHNLSRLTNFNVSVTTTDSFMESVEANEEIPLIFEDREYGRINAKDLWDLIMRSTYDYAEPGVIFIDRVNEMNNLYYCETIASTNPCGEQPLPPYGACLLGSINLTKFVTKDEESGELIFDYERYKSIIPDIVLMLDNIIDRSNFPLEAQKLEAQNKRRMGIGVTGLANAAEMMGIKYGTPQFLSFEESVLETLTVAAYRAGVELAKEKGAFPLFDAEKYCQSHFVQQKLPEDLQNDIKKYGIRNSHYTSIAPCGTISQGADNISSGLEPVFSYGYSRPVQTVEGPIILDVQDYAYRFHGVEGRTADQVSPAEHVDVLTTAQGWIDSACSKTVNLPESISFADFKDVYMQAYKGGAKGCTTYRVGGKRGALLVAKPEEVQEGAACFIDELTGKKECE